MTVGQLIDLLKAHDPALRVLVQGYEAGLNELDQSFVFTAPIALNFHAADKFFSFITELKLSTQSPDICKKSCRMQSLLSPTDR